MDIVEFAEKTFDVSLFDYQKEFLRRTYEEAMNNNKIFIGNYPRVRSHLDLDILRTLVLSLVMEDRQNQSKVVSNDL